MVVRAYNFSTLGKRGRRIKSSWSSWMDGWMDGQLTKTDGN